MYPSLSAAGGLHTDFSNPHTSSPFYQLFGLFKMILLTAVETAEWELNTAQSASPPLCPHTVPALAQTPEHAGSGQHLAQFGPVFFPGSAGARVLSVRHRRYQSPTGCVNHRWLTRPGWRFPVTLPNYQGHSISLDLPMLWQKPGIHLHR